MNRAERFVRRARRWRRSMRWWAAMVLVELARRVARALGHRAAVRLGAAAGCVAWLIAPGYRRRAQRQLIEAGLATPGARARRMSREVFRHLGMTLMEWLHGPRWTAEQWRERVCVEGLAHWTDAASQARGIVFVSCHMGNWELLPRAMVARGVRNVAVVMTDQRNPRLNEWIVARRRDAGVAVIPNSRSGLGLLRHLRRGGAVGTLVDQDTRRTRGLFVPFFGRPAYTPAGPAFLARRARCPIVPLTIARDAADPTRHRVRIAPAIYPDPALDEDADVYRMTAAYTQAIEAAIRETPEQWVWIHARWKRRPGDRIEPKR